MIREDNITLQTLSEDLTNEDITLKEYITRSEGAALFTVAINKELLNAYQNYPVAYKKVFNVISGEKKDLRFPSIFGLKPEFIPELSEIPFDAMDVSSTTIYPRKFGLRAGISQEMIDDNEVSLLAWTMNL